MTNQETGTPQSLPANRRPLVVLLVDDQPFVGAVLNRLLKTEQDIELHCCQKATDAIARANEVEPTLILQDLVMPDIDGLTLVGMFRDNPTTAHTPVIVLSGNDDAATRTRALAAGASDYLVKVPPKNELIASIRRHTTGQDAKGVSGSGHVTGREEARDDTLDAGVIATFRESDASGSSDFVVMLIDLFVKDAESHMAALRAAVPRRDAGVVKAAAHSLKGSSMTIGAKRFGAVCGRMEDDAKRSPDASVAPALMAALEEEFARVRDALATERKRPPIVTTQTSVPNAPVSTS